MILVLQAVAMLAAAIAFGRLARSVRLPAVIGELLAGIVLGPTLLNLFPPVSPGRDVLARIGLVCFLFVAGLEVNLQSVRRYARAIALTSVGGMIVPFASAMLAVRIAPSIWRQSLSAAGLSIFLGAALAISALPVIARIILDLGFEKLPLASVVLASATINDVLGWILFVVLVGGHAPEHVVSAAAFFLGVFASRFVEKRERLRHVVITYLAPFFFVSIGLGVDFISNFDWLLVAVVIVVASIGKISGVTAGARLGGFSMREAVAIGMAMNARGAVEMVLASVALQAKLIDARLFVALVVMAVVTSVIAGPSMQAMLAPISRSLQRESSSLQK